MLQRYRAAPNIRPTPWIVLRGMTSSVPIPYMSGFPSHFLLTLGINDGCPLICKNNTSSSCFRTRNPQQKTKSHNSESQIAETNSPPRAYHTAHARI